MLPPEASLEFSKFHNIFYSNFYNAVLKGMSEFKCKKCNTPGEYPVCQYCYIKEAIIWLEENNHGAAKKLTKMFFINSFKMRLGFEQRKKIRSGNDNHRKINRIYSIIWGDGEQHGPYLESSHPPLKNKWRG